jgi:hypothetical protein
MCPTPTYYFPQNANVDNYQYMAKAIIFEKNYIFQRYPDNFIYLNIYSKDSSESLISDTILLKSTRGVIWTTVIWDYADTLKITYNDEIASSAIKRRYVFDRKHNKYVKSNNF